MKLRYYSLAGVLLILSAFAVQRRLAHSYTSTITVGSHPFTFTVAGTKLYVINSGDNTISDINSLTNKVTDTITLPADNANYSLLVGTKLYVANSGGPARNFVSVIDTSNDTIIKNIAVGHAPAGPGTLELVGTKLYVNNADDDTLSVIDTASDTVIKTIATGADGYSAETVDTKIYLSDRKNGKGTTVAVVDTATDTLIKTITVGTGPNYFTLSGSKLYLSNHFGNSVSVIDTTTDVVTRTIVLHDRPNYPVAVNGKVYVSTGINDTTLSVISTATDTVIGTIDLGWHPYTLTPVGNKLYAAKAIGSSVAVIDTLTNTVATTIPIPAKSGPAYTALVGTTLYLANSNGVTVDAIDTLSDQPLDVRTPVLAAFSSPTPNGDYTAGTNVTITANFATELGAGSTMTVKLNTGASVELTAVSGSSLSGSYTVRTGNATPDLDISAITSASIKNFSGTSSWSSYGVPPPPQLTGFANGNIGDTSNISIGNRYKTIATQTNPYQVSAVGTTLYVANEGSGSVSVINSITDNAVATIRVGAQPYGVVFEPASKEIYVTNIDSNSVSVIDVDSTRKTYNTVTHTISVGAAPFYLAVIGSSVYVTNNLGNTVSVIGSRTHSVTATIPAGNSLLGIKAAGNTLYVADLNAGGYGGGVATEGYVTVIDSASNKVTRTIPVGVNPRGVVVAGNEIYVSNFGDGTVSAIDSTTNTVSYTIAVGSGPRGLLAMGSNVYVENFNSGTVSIIDAASHKATATVAVGGAPAGMAAVGTDIYITRFTDSELSVLDSTRNALTVLVPTGQPLR